VASIRSEYHRFLAHLAQRHVHDDVRRLAHLVLDHLQPLAEVGAARRGRSTRLAPLAIAHLAQMPVAYNGDARGPENGPALGRLHQLEVGPFRGFMRQETFDLSHDITLVYGANGTGKSSFCEALEVAMLGSISEAQAKRVDQRTYCNNARLRRHVAPVLSSRAEDQPQAVQPDEAEYRFCFIEKNRLDDFARIAARTPGDQRQLIATLFGVDQFSEFVRGFNPLLDQDLMLTGVQAAQLAQRRVQLANSEQTIAAYPQKIAAVEALEQALAQRMWPGATYQACVDWLLGTPQQQGRLPYVQAQLDANPPAIYEVTQARLQALLAELIVPATMAGVFRAACRPRRRGVIREALRGRVGAGGRGDGLPRLWNCTGRCGAGSVREGTRGPGAACSTGCPPTAGDRTSHAVERGGPSSVGGDAPRGNGGCRCLSGRITGCWPAAAASHCGRQLAWCLGRWRSTCLERSAADRRDH